MEVADHPTLSPSTLAVSSERSCQRPWLVGDLGARIVAGAAPNPENPPHPLSS